MKILSSRTFSILIFITAILAKLTQQLYYFSVTADRSSQLTATKNFIEGHGITLNQVSLANLSEPIYSPLIGWPPGYTILTSPIALLFNGDVILASLIFDLACTFIFIFFSRKILVVLECPVWLVNLFTLVLGFFLYDFARITTSDLNALSFFMWAIYMALYLLKKDKMNASYSISLAIINFIPEFIRYMYIPLAFVIPVYLIITGYKSKSQSSLKNGFIILGMTGILTFGLLLFQSLYTGAATYVSPNQSGFFPENLLEPYPVIFQAFVNIQIYYTIAQNIGLMKFGEYNYVILTLHAIVFLTLLYFLTRFLIKKNWRAMKLIDHYVILGSATSLLTIAIIGWLSLTTKSFKISFYEYRWTYIHEPRYMSFIFVFLQQLCFLLLYANREKIKSKLLKITGWVIAILLTLEVLHGIYFTTKLLVVKKEIYQPYPGYMDDMTRQLVKQLPAEFPAHEVLFTSTALSFINIANLHGAKVMYDPLILNHLPADERKFIGVAILDKREQHRFQAFINNPKTKKITETGDLVFYRYINP